jgi:acyl-CoA hydrolase
MGMTPSQPSASRVEMTHLVQPPDANVLGTVFGGRIAAWTDLAAAMAAMRHSRLPVVTASIAQLTFLAPIRVGHIAILHAQVTAVFRTSMEVAVDVVSEDPRTGRRRLCCESYLTFVGLGADGKPTEVPALQTTTEAERRREGEARLRRESRLALRARLRGE